MGPVATIARRLRSPTARCATARLDTSPELDGRLGFLPAAPGQDPQSARLDRRGLAVRSGSVREARISSGLSLAQVAGSELTRSAIHRIEKGLARPSLSSLSLIAERTGRPLSFFLESQAAPPQRLELRFERMAAEGQFQEIIDAARRAADEGALTERANAIAEYWVGLAYVRLTMPEAALEHLASALNLFERDADPWMAAHTLHMKSSALHLLDDPEALAVAEQALRRCRELKPSPPMLESRILNHLAAIALSRGESQQAIQLYQRALAAAEPLRDLRQLSLMYEGLGMAHHSLGRTAQAGDYFTRALALYQLQADFTSISRAETNLSALLLEVGDLSSAEEHLQRSLRYCDEHGVDRFNRTAATLGLARLRLLQGRLEEVDALTREAIEMGEGRGELLNVATARHLRAQLLLRLDLAAEADELLAAAIESFEALGLVDRSKACRIEWAEQLEVQGRTAEAARQWKLAALTRPHAGVPHSAVAQA